MAIATKPVRAPQISIAGAGKVYGGTWVLQDVSLEIEPGEIHALLGENGAGKSTLLKILAGVISADAGTLSLDDRVTTLGTPRRAIDAGISLISQELALVPDRSVIENVFLGAWSNRLGVVVGKEDRRLFDDLLERTGFDLDPDAIVRTLSIGKAQQVEVIRALARGSAVLCLDEPTAVLGEADTEKLLAILRQLASEGTTVILVSHFLEEVLSFADRLTVLRDGKHVATGAATDHSPDSLIKLMVGRQVDALAQEPPEIAEDAPVVLKAHGLSNDRIQDISLEVREGEILGLVGLVGSGRSETLNAIFGSDQRTSGTVTVDDVEVARNSVRNAMRRGIALVPESRKDQGLVLGRSGLENIALATLNLRQRLSFVRRGEERRKVREVAEQTDIRGDVHGAPVGLLSGGNQQKTLFAKWLVHPPRVLLVDEPTRGVDIAAKAKLHKLIIELAAKGTAVVVASSDLEELFALSHRMCVLKRGRIAGVYGRNVARDEIMSAAFI